jgi:hypothetical protein
MVTPNGAYPPASATNTAADSRDYRRRLDA